MSSIRERARAEMERAKFPEEDIKAVEATMEVFFKHFNSGGAVHHMAPILTRLIAGAPLSPLTGSDDEWRDMSSYEGAPAGTTFQNIRASSVFKRKDEDGNYVFTDVDHPSDDVGTRAGKGFRRIDGFPYLPEAVVSSPVMTFETKES